MDDEDDLLPPNQIDSNRRPQLFQRRLSQSQRPSSSQEPQLSQSDVSMLYELVHQLREGQRGVKRPAEQKPADKKPKRNEEFKCLIKHCKSVLASKVNLFRHMKNIHEIIDPERLYGCTMDNTIVNLDESLMEHKCSYCEFVSNNINALDAHNATVHGILPSVCCNVCSFRTSSSEELAVHSRSHVATTSTQFESFKDKMHKCDDCLCYFEEKGKFDEHMKKQHGFQAECKICNKNFLFKDFYLHVKSSHPEVYGKKVDLNVAEGKIKRVTLKLKSGKIKRVFECKKCKTRFDDESKAQTHARGHMKGVKARAVNNKRVVNKVVNQKDPPPKNNLLFICETCDIACESYDTAVQHSQNHITKLNAAFVTETCDTCKFKFESVSYEKHLDRHYKDKEMCRESFKTVNYKFNLLLSKDWIDSFNSDVDIKKVVAESIYANARNVKMRVISESATSAKVYNLYQCGKCDAFVEPTSVTNHTLNYDTCMKIKHTFACIVCKRKFSTSFLRDKHEKVHNGNESFRIIVFNAERDKKFNDILINREGLVNSNTDRNDGVIYKCMCGLCFVSKRKAEDHTKVCPGNDTKQNCPKCNSLFNISEIVSHFEQHLNGATQFKIEDFVSDPIIIDSDDDLESSNSIKDKDERVKDIKVEQPVDMNCDVQVFEVLDSDEEIESTSRTVRYSSCIPGQQTNIQTEVVPSTSTPNEDIRMEEIEGEGFSHDYESDDQIDSEANQEFELTLDNSQNVSSEALEDPQAECLQLNRCDINNTNETLNCVPISLLLSSMHRNNDESRAIENSAISQVRSEIEAVEQYIDTRVEPLVTATVKQEKLWLWDPTDYSYIGPRPSLRQIDVSHTPVMTYTIEETDDEDDLFLQNPDENQVENYAIERNNDTNTVPSRSNQTGNTDEEMNTRETIIALNTFNFINIANEIGLQPAIGGNESEHSEIVENNDDEEDNIAHSNSAVNLNRGLDFITNVDDSEGINSFINSDNQTNSLRQCDQNPGDISHCTASELIEHQMNAIERYCDSRDAEIGTFIDGVSSNEVSSNSHERNPDETLTVPRKGDLPKIIDFKTEIFDSEKSQTDRVEIASDNSKQILVETEQQEAASEREDHSELIQVSNEPIDLAIDLRNVPAANGLIHRIESNDFAIVSYRNEIDSNVEWDLRDRALASIGPSVRDVSSTHTHTYSRNYGRNPYHEIDSRYGRTNRVVRRANRTLNVPSLSEVVTQAASNNRRYDSIDNEIDNYNGWGRQDGQGPGFESNDVAFQNANDFRRNRVDVNVSFVMSDRNVMVKPNNSCCIS